MKIKSKCTEELVAKYLFGDITEHEKNNLTIGSRVLHNTKEFFNRLRTSASFRKRYEGHIHRLTLIRHGKHFKKKYCQMNQSHQFS